MKSKYEIILYWSEADEAFVAEVPELPGCMADGSTYEEALTNARVVIDEWIETASAKELLLCRRSLRPVFQVADELARLIRATGDRQIIAQLEADMAAGGGKESFKVGGRERGFTDPP